MWSLLLGELRILVGMSDMVDLFGIYMLIGVRGFLFAYIFMLGVEYIMVLI